MKSLLTMSRRLDIRVSNSNNEEEVGCKGLKVQREVYIRYVN